MSLATAVVDVRTLLRDMPFTDTITTAPTTGAGTSMVVSTAAAWEVGDVLEFTGPATTGRYEQVLITANSSGTLTIVRAYNETTAGTHTTAELARKNPRFGGVQIEEAINNVLDNETFPEIWQVNEASVTPSPTTTYIYDLPAAYEGFVDLVMLRTGTEDLVRIRATEDDNVPVAISATNKALRVGSWPRTDVNATLFYRARITSASFPADVEPVVAWGAVARLLKSEGAGVADRRDEQDRQGRIFRASRFFDEEFRAAKGRYRAGLMARWGSVRRYRRSRIVSA